MAMKAIHAKTNETIYMFHYEDREEIDIKLKPLQHKHLLRCANPDCGEPLMVRNGGMVSPHFAHFKSQCKTQYNYHPPSVLHERSKILIGEHMKQRYAPWAKVEVDYEVPIPSMKRIADVVLMFGNGILQAHEIQLASITTEQLRLRTIDYYKEGIDVQWWLGEKADTPANRQWLFANYGRAAIINPEKPGESEMFTIHDYTG